MGAVGLSGPPLPSLSPLRERDSRSRSERQGEGLLPDRKELLARARWMRANPTEAERRIWFVLRDRRFSGFKFRRQQIVYPYIVDFICLEHRLIIEADGSQHADNKADVRRDAFLRAQDFRLMRFWNNEVLAETDAVPSAIYAALTPLTLPSATRPAVPLPQRGEGR